MSLVDSIWAISEDRAYKRKKTARFSSALKTKTHKWKKTGNVTKTVASLAGLAIPIPGISMATDWMVQRVVDKRRASVRKKKQRTYSNAGDLEKEVKHGIKNIDVSELDRARYKVHGQINSLNGLFSTPKFHGTQCELAFNLAYRYHRAVRRVELLKVRAQVLQGLAQQIITWCDQLETSLDAKEDRIKKAVEDCLDHDPEDCGKLAGGGSLPGAKTGCFNSDSGDNEKQHLIQKVMKS